MKASRAVSPEATSAEAVDAAAAPISGVRAKVEPTPEEIRLSFVDALEAILRDETG
jgi:hypothetical protein